MIDPVLMEQAINDIARDEMNTKIRDWFSLNAPPELLAIYKRYQELETAKISQMMPELKDES